MWHGLSPPAPLVVGKGWVEHQKAQNTLTNHPVYIYIRNNPQAPSTSERKMNLLILILIFIPLFSSPSSAQDFDLPEVIGFIIEPPEAEEDIGSAFCWVGDQNGDGYDDLLVNHDPWMPGENYFMHNRVELFFGGEEMDDEPDMIFEVDEDSVNFGGSVRYFGRVDSESDPFFSIGAAKYYRHNIINIRRYLYRGNEALDVEPDIEMRRLYPTYNIHFGTGHRAGPTDLNNDGYNDIIGFQKVDLIGQIVILFGSEEFDTIPDYHVSWDHQSNYLRYSTGFDINGDSCHDFLLKTVRLTDDIIPHRYYHYAMYLGGDPPDTIPVFEFDQYHYENYQIMYGFSLLPDVNGDGYDDWAINLSHDNGHFDKYYLYYGSEDPDMEWDVELEGDRGIAGGDGDITGGDFNGDGFGDIVTGHAGGFIMSGEVHVYFGRPEISGDVDILINGEDDYGDEYQLLGDLVGAVGDYNGDGVDDFVARIEGHPPKIAIFAGNPEWVVNSVSNDLPDQFQLSFEALPNPFNAEAKLSVSLPFAGNVTLTVYDVYGRLVSIVTDSMLSDGSHDFVLNGGQLSSGVYFARLVFEGSGRRTGVFKKLVCLK